MDGWKLASRGCQGRSMLRLHLDRITTFRSPPLATRFELYIAGASESDSPISTLSHYALICAFAFTLVHISSVIVAIYMSM